MRVLPLQMDVTHVDQIFAAVEARSTNSDASDILVRTRISAGPARDGSK